MSTKTTNLELVKPGLDDTRDITVLNDDFDIIDEAVAARALKSEAVKNITRSGKTFTVTRCNGTTFTFDQQDTTYGDATTSAHGLMTAADKSKLNGIANNANNYSLPLAANGTRGGVQVGYSQNGRNFPVQLSGEKMYVNVPGYTLPEASSSTLGGVKTGYSQNGKNYPVALSSGKMFVYVPWVNTEYNDATTSQHGLMSAADKTKLNGIAAGAQVNPGNATQSAAGLMSSADKAKLDGIAAGAQVNPTVTNNQATLDWGEYTTIAQIGNQNITVKLPIDGLLATKNFVINENIGANVPRETIEINISYDGYIPMGIVGVSVTYYTLEKFDFYTDDYGRYIASITVSRSDLAAGVVRGNVRVLYRKN